MPKSITIHDVDDATANWLTEEAKRQGTSVERVAGQLLRRALEWERRQAELPTYHDLDAFAGRFGSLEGRLAEGEDPSKLTVRINSVERPGEP